MGGNCVGTGCVCVCVWEEWGLPVCGNRNMVEGEAKNMGKGVCVVCLWCNILGMMPHF